jgi:hypothetical protein
MTPARRCIGRREFPRRKLIPGHRDIVVRLRIVKAKARAVFCDPKTARADAPMARSDQRLEQYLV